jgi:hypothetical protein
MSIDVWRCAGLSRLASSLAFFQHLHSLACGLASMHSGLHHSGVSASQLAGGRREDEWALAAAWAPGHLCNGYMFSCVFVADHMLQAAAGLLRKMSESSVAGVSLRLEPFAAVCSPRTRPLQSRLRCRSPSWSLLPAASSQPQAQPGRTAVPPTFRWRTTI